MNIHDCFLFNGEEKMLNFRLHELDEFVDKFIIVESEFTFKGDKKELVFPKIQEKLSKFSNKIIYRVFSKPPNSNAWQNEREQRNYLKEGFRNLVVMSNDVIMLSDVDEIPDLQFLENIHKEGFTGVKTSLHNFYYYNYKCRKNQKWPGTVIIDVNTFLLRFNFDFENIRASRHSFSLIGQNGDYNSGGWHFSYFGDVDYIINKIQSFSHQEYNNDNYTDPIKIRYLIDNGRDLFFRENEDMKIIENQTYLPRNIHLLN